MLMTERLSRLRILASGIVLLPLTAGSAVAPQSSPPANSPIVFLNVNVVPMDAERILENQTVIVRGEKIDLVGPSNTSEVPSAFAPARTERPARIRSICIVPIYRKRRDDRS